MKTPQQIAMDLYTSGTFYSPIVADGDLMRDVMVAAIEADRAQRKVIPSMFCSSELQGAVDEFNDAWGADYLSVLAAGQRLRDIVNDYLDQVLIHVDRI